MNDTPQFYEINKRTFRFSCLLIIFFFCLASRSDAQWTKIGNNVFYGPVPLDNAGALGFKDGTLCGGTHKIMISLDTGQTWKSAVTLAKDDYVMSIDFFNSFNFIVKTTQKLYNTTDQGNTWSNQTIAGVYACFAGSQSNIVVCSNYSIYTSTNAGTSWTKTHDAPTGSFMITCAKYRGNGVVIALEDQHLLISTDYGSTWKASNNYFSHSTDSWTLALSPCDSSNQVFVANENLGGSEKPAIYSTTNYGNTWQSLIQRPASSLDGFITTSGNSIFFGTAVTNLQKWQGVFRSTDRGVTWDSIGGPSTYYQDSRLLAPVNNNLVLACDDSGNIWRTYNAGGSPVSSSPPIFMLPKQITINECQRDSSQIIITGFSCHRYHLLSARLTVGPDLPSFRLKGKFPPLILSEGASDTMGIIFDARQLNGTLHDNMIISWYDEGDGIVHDSTIAIPITVNPAAPNLVPNTASLHFDTAKLCMRRDTIIKFRNMGCDTLNITGASLTPPGTISIDPLTLPLIVPTDSSVLIHVHFQSPVSGGFTATAQFQTEHRGLTNQISIPVTAFGFGTDGGLTAKDSFITLKPVTSCSPYRDTLITIINNGCDTITITSGPDGFGNGFSANPLSLPMTIPPGRSIVIPVHFQPPGIGNFQTTISFNGDLEGFAQVKTILLRCQNLGSNPGLTSMDTVVDFHNVSLCNSYRDTDIKLFNRGCDTLSLVGGPGTLANGFTADPLPLPLRIPPDSSVTIHYHFHPQGPSQYKTIAIFIATANGKTQQFYQPLAGSGHVTVTGPPVLQSSFMFDTISICSSGSDTIIWLANRSCDTLKITGGPGTLGPGFSSGSLSFPVILLTNDSISVIFHFLPPGVGKFTANPTFNLELGGKQNTFAFSLEGSGKSEQGSLSFYPKQLHFKSLSICSQDSASVFIFNSGCGPINIDPATINSDPDFKLKANSSPLSMKPNDTLRFVIFLNPQQQGLRRGSLILISLQGAGIHYDTILIDVTITGGSKILSASVNAVDFGATTMCDNGKDTTITLHNSGCDTLQVFGVGGLLSGFGTNTKFPIILLPGHDTTINIFTILDTVGGKTSNSASLTFTTNADNIITPVTLSRSYIASKKVDLGLFLDPAMKNGGDQSTVSYDIKESTGKSFTGVGIRQITFDLNRNSDLLEFNPAKSTPNLITSDGKSFSFSSASEITADAKGILASIGFNVYLTKDSVTALTLANVKIGAINTSPCQGITTLSYTSDTAVFNYSFFCGERSIAGFMNGVMPMKIISIRPNPAQDEIAVDLRSSAEQNTAIEIFDALGVKKFSDRKNITNGTNSIHIDTKGLSSGMYVVRVGMASQSLIINR